MRRKLIEDTEDIKDTQVDLLKEILKDLKDPYEKESIKCHGVSYIPSILIKLIINKYEEKLYSL